MAHQIQLKVSKQITIQTSLSPREAVEQFKKNPDKFLVISEEQEDVSYISHKEVNHIDADEYIPVEGLPIRFNGQKVGFLKPRRGIAPHLELYKFVNEANRYMNDIKKTIQHDDVNVIIDPIDQMLRVDILSKDSIVAMRKF